MRAVFLALLGLSIMSCQTVAVGIENKDEDILLVSTLAEDIAKDVYVGEDRDMPTDGTKHFAIQPTKTRKGYFVPSTFGEAFVELKRMTPAWQRVAMLTGTGDNECAVTVNGIPYGTTLYSWVEVNWRLDDDNSPAAKMLREESITDEEMKIQALIGGFCEYLKHGEAAGIAEIRKYGVPDSSRAPASSPKENRAR